MSNRNSSPASTTTSSLNHITALGLLVTLGIVFGDIGTSPLYVMKAIGAVNPGFDADYITGAVSCVIWTLTLQTTVKYVLIALRADNNGEGGILALFSLLRHIPRRHLYVAAALGAATLIADGVITPAITVTSAMEGLHILNPRIPVLPLVCVIIVAIFMLQRGGTNMIGHFFGPFMLLWFLTLGILGCSNIGLHPDIWHAFNPWYAIKLLINYPGWFLILGAVFLCTTGAEALYSDLGHCGRMNISAAWLFVKAMLILNYLGQGAWMIAHGSESISVNPFYGMMPGWFTGIGVVMATGAAIIASQALISGSFTLFSEAIGLDFWPKLRIKYPSNEKGQLYIPTVNWALMAGCLLTVSIFRDSARMEAAYGLAITVTMLMTTILITFYIRLKGTPLWICSLFFMFFAGLESIFLLANVFKFTHGGWFSMGIAIIIAAVMLLWYNSTRIRHSFIEYKRLDNYSQLISDIKADTDIPQYASNIIYFSRSANYQELESKLLYSIINKHPKRADHYWIIHIENVDDPNMLEYSVKVAIPQTLYFITMRIGFRIAPKVSMYLRQIVEDLVDSGELDITSNYRSLHSRGIAGDFKFIILHRIFSPSSSCSRPFATLMNIHEHLRRMGITEQQNLGLDTSSVTVETVPLIISTTPQRRIRRTS